MMFPENSSLESSEQSKTNKFENRKKKKKKHPKCIVDLYQPSKCNVRTAVCLIQCVHLKTVGVSACLLRPQFSSRKTKAVRSFFFFLITQSARQCYCAARVPGELFVLQSYSDVNSCQVPSTNRSGYSELFLFLLFFFQTNRIRDKKKKPNVNHRTFQSVFISLPCTSVRKNGL